MKIIIIKKAVMWEPSIKRDLEYLMAEKKMVTIVARKQNYVNLMGAVRYDYL